jgi:DNA-binding response OmpR family regulator
VNDRPAPTAPERRTGTVAIVRPERPAERDDPHVAAAARGLPGLPVELVHWPREQRLRTSLARAGVARLLLVDADAPPPEDVGLDEDWIRLPADERDVVLRAERLSLWLAHLDRQQLVLDADRVAHRAGRVAVLSSVEAAALSLLLERATTVSRADLEAAMWPDGAPSTRSLDNAIYRLRVHLEPLGVAIRSSRTRGFRLDPDVAGGRG